MMSADFPLPPSLPDRFTVPPDRLTPLLELLDAGTTTRDASTALFGDQHSRMTIQRWVAQLTSRGLAEVTGPGRRGLGLTDDGRDLLARLRSGEPPAIPPLQRRLVIEIRLTDDGGGIQISIGRADG